MTPSEEKDVREAVEEVRQALKGKRAKAGLARSMRTILAALQATEQRADKLGYERCMSPRQMEINLVTGNPVPKFEYCFTHRKASSCGPRDCGSEGLFWEPAE